MDDRKNAVAPTECQKRFNLHVHPRACGGIGRADDYQRVRRSQRRRDFLPEIAARQFFAITEDGKDAVVLAAADKIERSELFGDMVALQRAVQALREFRVPARIRDEGGVAIEFGHGVPPRTEHNLPLEGLGVECPLRAKVRRRVQNHERLSRSIRDAGVSRRRPA
jgi:hypothetical protein